MKPPCQSHTYQANMSTHEVPLLLYSEQSIQSCPYHIWSCWSFSKLNGLERLSRISSDVPWLTPSRTAAFSLQIFRRRQKSFSVGICDDGHKRVAWIVIYIAAAPEGRWVIGDGTWWIRFCERASWLLHVQFWSHWKHRLYHLELQNKQDHCWFFAICLQMKHSHDHVIFCKPFCTVAGKKSEIA